jgi:hypothetical protein
MAKRDDLPDWDYFVKAAGAMIEYINDKFQSNGNGMDGKTRTQVFNENLPAEVRRVGKEQLQEALCRSEVRKCSRGIIRMNRTKYGHPELGAFSGQNVVVKNSLLHDDTITVYDLHCNRICEAAANYYREGDDLSETNRRLESAKKLTLTQLAERGTNEMKIATEQKLMLETAMQIYDEKLPAIDQLFGDEEPLKKAAGAENMNPHKPSKYRSRLEATDKDFFQMEVQDES